MRGGTFFGSTPHTGLKVTSLDDNTTKHVYFLIFFSYFKFGFVVFAGARSLATRRSLFTLMLGVFVGFCLAIIFVSEPSRHSWLPYGGHHIEAELRDPHTGNDLAGAVGPILDVG